MGGDRSRDGLCIATTLVPVLLCSCYDSHAPPIDGQRVRVEQVQRDTASGLRAPMPPVDATVVAWSCDGLWSAEAGVDSGGLAVFQPPDGLDCWHLTAVDLHFPVGGGASTVLRAPIPFDGAIMLPGGFRDDSRATADGVELSGRVMGLPEGTDAVEITSNVEISFEGAGPPTVVGSDAHFEGRIERMPAGEPIQVTALAMRGGFPIHGAEVELAMPASGGVSVELALPPAPATIGRAELTVHVPDVLWDPAEGPFAHVGRVHLERRPGGSVGHVRFERGAGAEWVGEARWVALSEGSAILCPTFAWATEFTPEGQPVAWTTLRACGNAEALSVMTIPDVSDQRITFEPTGDASRLQADVSIGHEDLVARVTFAQGWPSAGRAWRVERDGPGRIELEDWPRLPASVEPEDVLGADPPLTVLSLRTPHEAGPDGPASFRITAPELLVGFGATLAPAHPAPR